jgi:hypothetical protein
MRQTRIVLTNLPVGITCKACVVLTCSFDRASDLPKIPRLDLDLIDGTIRILSRVGDYADPDAEAARLPINQTVGLGIVLCARCSPSASSEPERHLPAIETHRPSR